MRCAVLVAACALTAACEPGPPLLADASPSADVLAREVLAALHRGDETRLERLALSEDEFRVHVWPQLPASQPARNLPFSYVWGDLRQKSGASLASLVSRYSGRSLELAGVAFAGETTDYGRFQVHREAIFHVREQGQLSQVRACGSMIVRNGQWKVFSYVVDE